MSLPDVNVVDAISDILLTAKWELQEASPQQMIDEYTHTGHLGNVIVHRDTNVREDKSVSAVYIGSDAFVTDFGIFATAFGQPTTDVAGTAFTPTRLRVVRSHGNNAMVEMQLHRHAYSNNHVSTTGIYANLRTFDISAALQNATIGMDIDDILNVASGTFEDFSTGDASCQSVTQEFALEHLDEPGYTAVHFAGQNLAVIETITAEFVGLCADPLTTAAAALAGATPVVYNAKRAQSVTNQALNRSTLTAKRYYSPS